MKYALIGIGGLSIIVLMISPAFAEVTSVDLQKSFYTDDEGFIFEGVESVGNQRVNVIIHTDSDKFVTIISSPSSDKNGNFSTFPKTVESIFDREGEYVATAFTDEQKEESGVILRLLYKDNKLSIFENFTLALRSIPDKTVEVEKTVTFTAAVTDSSINDLVFSLNNEPSGAKIDSKTGKFAWTPQKSHGNIQDVHYSFDVMVTNGVQEDKEEVTITVKQAFVEPEPTKQEPTKEEPKEEPKEDKEPEPLEIPASFVDESKDPQSYVDRYNNEASYKKWFDDNYSEYDSIEQAVGLEVELVIPASFVDESKDPQSYVDRYNNEASYKKWFDDNYSEYDSIEQAVGLEVELVIPASFVDESKDPQSYVDRYNNEASYKKWFDDNYSEYDSIEQAVGLEDTNVDGPVMEEAFGECGNGTSLVDGICKPDQSSGGGCLIATAAYGSEMAPQVQLLREIRDNQLMNTSSGVSFMSGFNQIYYSFSPAIADAQRENPLFKETVRIAITPMLASLSIMGAAESESEVLGYGIGAILMNLGLYVGIPAVVIYKSKKHIRA